MAQNRMERERERDGEEQGVAYIAEENQNKIKKL